MGLGSEDARVGSWCRRPVLGAVLAMACVGCGEQTSATQHAVKSQHAITQSPERTVAGDWAAPNSDLANTRRVGGPINTASVSRLRVAWTLPLVVGYVATPVIYGGVAYTQDLLSNVYAIDVPSGKVLWKQTINDTDIGPNGVNIGDGRVYGATRSVAFALDAKTGKPLWIRPIALHHGDMVDMAPGYKDGTVYISTAVASGGAVGTLWAIDGATGKTKWKWEQVPSSLWGRPDVNGAGGLWHPPAFDDRGSLYMGIANPLPFPGTASAPWGSSRPGDNKWTNSIVKLNARTGKLIWGHQVLPHDLYDWDLECPVILARAHRRRVALAAGKMGFVYEFDAATGALLWKRSVGLHNGHDNDNLLALHRNYARLRFKGPRTILPGDWGGVQTPMASDGETVYVPVNNLSITYFSQVKSQQQDLNKGTGEVVALDVRTGRVKWDRKLPHSVYGAATVSNDVVFTTTYDGKLWALSTRTGEVAWTSQLPAGTDAPVVVAGNTLITAASIPLGPTDKPQIVAYRLG
jgi:alcohol dehydrogenase (cytochrome c)